MGNFLPLNSKSNAPTLPALMTIWFCARTDFCAGAVKSARVTISPSTETESQESSRALITTSNGAFDGTAGRGWVSAEVGGTALTAGNAVGRLGSAVATGGSLGFEVAAEESSDSAGFGSGCGCSAVAAGAVLGGLAAVAFCAGAVESLASFSDSRE